MRRLFSLFNFWPVLFALTLCVGLAYVAAVENLGLSFWEDYLIDPEPDAPRGKEQPKDPPRPRAQPRRGNPGEDDRTPVEHISARFGLNDLNLPSKLSGVGPIFWAGRRQGTGAVFARADIVLTTGHAFAKKGKWNSPNGPTLSQPSPSHGTIYLEACNQSYRFKVIELGSTAPRANLGLDYAIGQLDEPVCEGAAILYGATLSDNTFEELATGEHILLSLGAYPFRDVKVYRNHPDLTGKPTRFDRLHNYHVFGVVCRMLRLAPWPPSVSGLETALYETEGCDAVPGGSGGPLLVSVDGGASYRVIGVTNSYRPNTEYNNYTTITGALLEHINTFVHARVPS